jgi:hypothetical protein
VETVKSSVEALCTKIYTLSAEHVKKIRERHVALLKENGLNDPTPPVPPGHRKEEICTPIQFALPPIRLPVVDYQFERDHINVKYTYPTAQAPDTHTLNMTHLQKLVSSACGLRRSILTSTLIPGATLPLQLRRQLFTVHPAPLLYAETLLDVPRQLLARAAGVGGVADVDSSLSVQLPQRSLRRDVRVLRESPQLLLPPVLLGFRRH